MLKRTIKQLHHDLKSNKTTVKNVLDVCNKQAGQVKDLNAVVKLNPFSSSQAETSQEHYKNGKPRSLLEGIPITVKDNFCIKNLETTCGSKMLKNFKPTYNATVVDKLFSAGCMLIGKTNLDEFAMGSGTIKSIHGPTKNIWGTQEKKSSEIRISDWYICGGSSGGSAVAVASGVCLGALGSDTGGSTRNPASYCGVVGLKPTYGLLSRHGLIPLVNSMDVPGILAATVEDAALILDCIAGPDDKDSTTIKKPKRNLKLEGEASVKGLKIGLPVEYNCESLSDEVRQVWKTVGLILEQGGATVLPISMPHTQHSIVCYSVLNQCEVASNMARYDGMQFGYRSGSHGPFEQVYAKTRAEGFGSVVRQRILAGNYFLLQRNYDKYFVKALKVRRLISDDFQQAWRQGFHLLLTPTTLTDAPLYSEFIKKDERQQCATEDYCTQPANMAGCPAISIPIQLSNKKLPLSVQLMAPNFSEQTMLKAAQYIEAAVQFSQKR